VVVGDFASVSEVHVASIFGVEVCRWVYCCVYTCIAVCFEKKLQNGGIVGIGALPRPVGTVDWESCAKPFEGPRNA
jgi:hypothetical protein